MLVSLHQLFTACFTMVLYDFKNKLLTGYDMKSRRDEVAKMDEWKKVEAEVFKFAKVGDTIEGKLIAVERGQQFNNKVYKINTPEGVKAVFGTAVLEQQMDMVSLGQTVRILFSGEKAAKKAGQNKMKLFEVFVK